MKRQTRLKREFIYRRSIEARDAESQRRKDLLRSTLQAGKRVPRELKQDALQLNEELDWSDEGGEGVVNAEDDEYYWAGAEDPRVVVTTSRSPSSRLKEFAKELRFLIPNATKINRGGYQNKDLVDACIAKQVSNHVVSVFFLNVDLYAAVVYRPLMLEQAGCCLTLFGGLFNVVYAVSGIEEYVHAAHKMGASISHVRNHN